MPTYTAGLETLVNTTQTRNQTPNYHGHTVTGLPLGGYVIVWQGGATDGFFDIFMQRYDGVGNKVGGETVVNTTTAFGQILPNVNFLADGGYVVAWTSYTGVDANNVPTGGDVFFQRYTAAGVKVGGETRANTTTADEQDAPSIIGLNDGGFFLTWDSKAQDGDVYGVYGQRYDVTGTKVGGEIHVSTSTTGTQDSTALAVVSGGLVVVYESSATLDANNNATNYDILMQRYDSTGAAVGGEVVVNTSATGNQSSPSITVLAGGFVVTWIDNSGGAGHALIKQQMYLSNGTTFGAETTVNNTSHSGDAAGTNVTVLLSGNYVVTWSMSDSTGTNYDVYLQEFTGLGQKVGNEIRVNTATAGNQVYSSVAVLSDGSYVVSYRSPDSDGQGVYHRVFYIDQTINDLVAGGHTLTGGYGSDTINGNDGNDNLDGGNGPGRDTLNGGDGDDVLNIWGGDNAYGGNGDDILKVTHLTGEFVFTDLGAGYDTLDASLADGGPGWIFTNSQNIERYIGGAFGESVDAHLVTNVAVFTFSGGNGNDTVQSGSGNDILSGDAGNDYISGGTGNDDMTGGAGDDSFVVDAVGDKITEGNGGGTDTVLSFINYSLLATNLENLSLFGTAINATGNSFNNILVGNDVGNLIDGKAGADSMTGGNGNDTYIVENVADVIVEFSGGTSGIDTVNASVSHTLSDNVEILQLTGTANINGVGNASANTMTGNGANNGLNGMDGDDVLSGGAGLDVLTGGIGRDRLDGGTGADRMNGGSGDDTYVIDDAADLIQGEANGLGNDTVISGIAYSLLGTYLENITLTGSASVAATGNGFNNVLNGNNGNNIINGQGGVDTMAGGKGNDIYYIDNAGDSVTEIFNEGIDTVYTQITYALTGNVENLFLQDTSAINGTGNGFANILIGNSFANTLDGGDGADVMHGGGGGDTMSGGLGADRMYGDAGDDTYIAENSGDRASEQAANGSDTGGIDLVQASVSYVLGAFIENLTLTGAGKINGVGNALGNALTGNDGINSLNGSGGDDVIDGKGGRDTYAGGTGADLFVFGLLSGTDTISDFHAVENDRIDVSAYNAQATAIITQSGTSALINLGGGNVITVLNTTATDANFLSHIIWS